MDGLKSVFKFMIASTLIVGGVLIGGTVLAAKKVPPMRTPPTMSVEAIINLNTLFKTSIKFPLTFYRFDQQLMKQSELK